MANVLITGGAGFIGSHVADLFCAAGNSVSIIDDLSSGCRENVPQRARLHVVDIRSPEAVRILKAEQPSIVVHAAAQMSVRLSMEDPVHDAELNVVGMVNVLNALRGLPQSPRFVFISTGGAIYGEQSAFPAAEDHPQRPASVYGLAKKVGEMYLEFWQREFGLRGCVLRLANVYGPRQNPHGEAGVVAIFCKMLAQAARPTIYGSGRQTRDFVYVEDVARAVFMAANSAADGIYNIGTGKESSINEIYSALARAFDSNLEAQYAPGKPGEQMRSSIDASRARRELGWSPELSVEQGLARTASWFRSSIGGRQ